MQHSIVPVTDDRTPAPRLPWFVAPLISSVVVLTIKHLSSNALGKEAPFILLGLSILVSGWFSGGRGALLSTFLGAVATWYWFLPPYGTLAIHDPLPIIAFSAEGVAISFIVHRLKVASELATAASLREADTRKRLETIALVTGELSKTVSRGEVADVVVEHGVRAMKADTCTLYILEDDALVLIAERGTDPAVTDKIRRLEHGNPVFGTLESDESVFVESADGYAKMYPEISGTKASGRRARAFWSVPLVIEGRPLGLIGMGFYEERTFASVERTFITAFAGQIAQALRRVQRLETESHALDIRDAQRTFLANVTNILSSSLDYESTLAEVAALVVPRLADWCSIDLIGEHGSLQQLAVAHADPAKVELARSLGKKYPTNPDAPQGAANVAKTGKSELFEHIPAALVEQGAKDAEHLQIIRGLQLRSALVVPLVARRQVLGAITLVYAESGRRYVPDDVSFVEEFGRRAGVAVDNARLFAIAERGRVAADGANRAKDEFLAAVSHELRTPLHAILGWARMMSGGTLAPDRVERAVEVIERNAVNMTQLIEDLLDVSRIISGKMRLDVQNVDVARVIDASIDSVSPAADAKGIRVHAVVDGNAGPIVGDAARLQQIVWNLLSNAVKFTPKGGKIEVVVRKLESSVEVVVTDSGKGIDAAFLPYVFEPFRQASAGATRTHGGLGLGLAIVKQLAELHGGRVEAESEGEGKGATFRVLLPIAAVRLERRTLSPLATAAVIPNSERPAALQGLRVLVVDDEPDARTLLQSILENAGCKVRCAGGVDEAMAEIATEVPDLLLSDIGMPTHDGYELIRRIRALPGRGGNMPAAALTAFARAEDRRRVLDAGYMMHVAKPVDPAELVSVVANLARFAVSRSSAVDAPP